jgi:hypothetical protein
MCLCRLHNFCIDERLKKTQTSQAPINEAPIRHLTVPSVFETQLKSASLESSCWPGAQIMRIHRKNCFMVLSILMNLTVNTSVELKEQLPMADFLVMNFTM